MTDEKKKSKFLTAISGRSDYKEQCKMLSRSAPKLTLTVSYQGNRQILSSATLQKGQQIILNAMGIESEESKRQDPDGYTYFGCKKNIRKNEGTNFLKTVVNDFVIPSKSTETAEQHRGRHFQIWFDPDLQLYKIKDLGIGYGVFFKIVDPVILKDNMLINIGEAYLVVYLMRDSDPEQHHPGETDESGQPRLKLKLYGGPQNGEIFYFKNDGKEIAIGRTMSCDIRIEDKLLSKTQSTISFHDGNWIVTDGSNGRQSTNGTWVYLNEDFNIFEGMTFKANYTIFQAHYY